MSDELTVRRNEDEARYEAAVEGGQAVIAYRLRPDTTPPVIVLTHTEIPPEGRGGGVGGRLARGVLDDIRRRGEKVVAQCPFVAGWIERHPDYGDLLSAEGMSI